jgi:transcriptional regulator with XRE-family HTH domain
MTIYEKIKILRLFNNLTQEEMAEKLGYGSVQGYAKIERGEANLTVAKLEEIAKVLNVKLQDLLNLKSKNALNIAETIIGSQQTGCDSIKNPACVIFLTEAECLNELHKLRLVLHEKELEIEHLKFEISLLKKLVDLSA